MDLARLTDLHDLRMRHKEKYSQLNKELEAEKKRIEEIEQQILEAIQNSKLDRMTISGVTYFPQTREIPVAEDWDAVYDYIRNNDALYLLQRRLHQSAAIELIQGGEQIPGVVVMTQTKLGARKES